MEVLTKKQTIELIEFWQDFGLLNRISAAEYLDMSIPTFDRFVSDNPGLKKKNGKRIRYCPKELKSAFQNN